MPAVGLFNRAKGSAGREKDLSPDKLVHMAENMRFQGKFDKGLRYCDQALLTDPENEAALAEKAMVLTGMGKYAEAMEFFNRVGQDSTHGTYPIIHAGRCTALVKLGRMDEALEYCNKAIEAIPARRAPSAGVQGNEIGRGIFKWYRGQLFRDKVTILNHLGRYVEALEFCDRILAVVPDDLRILNYKGHALYGLGRYKKAFEVTETAIDYDPSYLPVFILRSQALYRLGEGKRALGIIKDVLKIEPDNEDAIRVQKTIREGTD